MEHKHRIAGLLAGAVLLLSGPVVSGCGSGSCVAPLARGAGLTLFTTGGAAASQQVSGTAPLAVGAALTATPGMDDAAHSGSALTSKAELDFGDGAGWQDVTAQQHAAGPAWGASLAQSVPHAYAAPGSYTLRGRVTYWDGTLYEAWNPYTITVH